MFSLKNRGAELHFGKDSSIINLNNGTEIPNLRRRKMKKFVAIILTIALFFVLVGCTDSGAGVSQIPSENPSSGSDFKAPEGYAALVCIEINPVLNLYLDSEGVVLAVEYVNDDAKNWYKGFEEQLVGKDCSESIETLLDIACDISPALDNDIKVNLVESVDTVDKNELIGSISATLNDYIAEKELDIETKYEIGGVDKTEEFKDNSANDEDEDKNTEILPPVSSEALILSGGVEYYLIKPAEDPEIMRYGFTFNIEEMYCSYSESPYSYEYGEPDITLEYNGKTYHQAGGRGGRYTLTLQDGVYTLADDSEYMRFKVKAGETLEVIEVSQGFGSSTSPIEVGDIIKR